LPSAKQAAWAHKTLRKCRSDPMRRGVTHPKKCHTSENE
jgi:hypothetical protein